LGRFYILLGIINLIYFLFINARRISFSSFFLFLGIILVLFGVFHIKFGNLIDVKYPKIFLVFKVVMITILISFLAVESLIAFEGSKKQPVKSDYILVLGAGLWGEIPSDVLYKRMDAALEYVNKNPDVKIILSGGKGPGEKITESEAMERYFVKHGVNKERIFREEKSTNTVENIKYTKELISTFDKRENISVTIATSNFHMLRSKLIARSAGFEVHEYSAPILSWLIPVFYTREYFAVIKYVVFR